jgi:hypothetical protein
MVAAMSLRWLLTAVFAAAALGALPVRKQSGASRPASIVQGRAVTTCREARASGRFWSRRRHPRSDLNAPNSGESKADRVSDGFHALMCAALIVMTWRSGPLVPEWLQVAVFGCAVIWFCGPTLGGSARSRTPRLPGLHHALMAGAMIWMITAIPVAMPMASAGPAASAMSGMPPPALTAVLVVSVLLAAYCGLATIPWLLQAAGPGRRVTGRGAASHAAMSAGMAALLMAML